MSNLFKQQYLVNVETKTRVINSDDRFTAGFQALQTANYEIDPNKESVSHVFMEGLNAEEVFIEPEPDPEEILAEAHLQADDIIAQAQAEALRISTEASQKADMLFERTKLEAYKEGVSKLQDELIAKSQEIEEKYKEKEQLMQAAYEEKMDALEADLVDVMIQVFQKVFHIQFDNKKQILLQLIKDTLLDIDAGKNFVIRVSQANYKYVESHAAEIREKIGNDVAIDVVNDATMDDEACIIETATGVYDCGIDMVMSNLEKDIRVLCR